MSCYVFSCGVSCFFLRFRCCNRSSAWLPLTVPPGRWLCWQSFAREFGLQQAAAWVKSLTSFAAGGIQLAGIHTQILLYLALAPCVLCVAQVNSRHFYFALLYLSDILSPKSFKQNMSNQSFWVVQINQNQTFSQETLSISTTHLFPQNQFGYRDGGPNTSEGSVAGAQACVNQEATGGPAQALEDQRCNGSLHKKTLSHSGAEDSGGQRYSADPTIFLGERASRGDTDEDGYMTPMKDKSSSGTPSQTKQSSLKYERSGSFSKAFWWGNLSLSRIFSVEYNPHVGTDNDRCNITLPTYFSPIYRQHKYHTTME